MNLLAVVLAQLLLLLGGPAAQRLLEVKAAILGADHEADLARGVGRDRGVAVLDVGEDFLASLLQVDDERHVKPLVLSYRRKGLVSFSSTLYAMVSQRLLSVFGEEGAHNLEW